MGAFREREGLAEYYDRRGVLGELDERNDFPPHSLRKGERVLSG